jgi:hypothetical protein
VSGWRKLLLLAAVCAVVFVVVCPITATPRAVVQQQCLIFLIALSLTLFTLLLATRFSGPVPASDTIEHPPVGILRLTCTLHC